MRRRGERPDARSPGMPQEEITLTSNCGERNPVPFPRKNPLALWHQFFRESIRDAGKADRQVVVLAVLVAPFLDAERLEGFVTRTHLIEKALRVLQGHLRVGRSI